MVPSFGRGESMRVEGVEPSWADPPVSETGASAGFRHIRWCCRGAPAWRVGRGASRSLSSVHAGGPRGRRRRAGLAMSRPRAPGRTRRSRSPAPVRQSWPRRERRHGARACSRSRPSTSPQGPVWITTSSRPRPSVAAARVGGIEDRRSAARSEHAAGEVRDQLRRRGVEADDVEHARVVRVGDREAVRDHSDDDQLGRDARRRGGTRAAPGPDGRRPPRSRSRCRSRTCRSPAPGLARTASAARSRCRRTAGR